MDGDELRVFDTPLPALNVPYDFRPIKIRVYRNGDENDFGKDVTVTRREFKHWIVFLDALTRKLGTTTAVNRLHTVHGERIDHFEDLQTREEYVAVEKAAFIPCDYGKYRPDRREREEKTWKSTLHMDEEKPVFLNSAETMDIYLKHEGYGSSTGLPYPLDSILAYSPSNSTLHLHSHAHVEKFGGSLEKLSTVGRPVWTRESGKEQSKSDIHLPKLVGLEDSNKPESVEKVSTVPVLPPIGGERLEKPPKEEKREVKMFENVPVTGISSLSLRKPVEKTTPSQLEDKAEDKIGPQTLDKATQKDAEDGAVSPRKEPDEHIIVPILVSKSQTTPKMTQKPLNKVGRSSFLPSNGRISTRREGSHHSVHWTNDRSFDDDLDDRQSTRKSSPPLLRRSRGVEKIFERSERRVIRRISDDDLEPVKQLVNSSSSYKTYLWEARSFDPDFD